MSKFVIELRTPYENRIIAEIEAENHNEAFKNAKTLDNENNIDLTWYNKLIKHNNDVYFCTGNGVATYIYIIKMEE